MVDSENSDNKSAAVQDSGPEKPVAFEIIQLKQRLTVNPSSSVSQWSKICLILSFSIHMKKFFQNKKLKNTQNPCSFSVHFPIQRSEIYVPNCKCVFFGHIYSL